MEHLVAALASLQRRLREHSEMNVTEEEANVVVHRVASLPDVAGAGRRGSSADVVLVPVQTYVHQLEKRPGPWSSAIVVPPFACHWGIVVGEPNTQRLFHLLFCDGARPGTSTTNDNIQFDDFRLRRPLENGHLVGQTRYNTDQLVAIGNAMVKEFGTYHKLFWNCQTFAKCYLRVITGELDATFDHWTSADTSRLFMCAFLVGAPVAKTNKTKENVRMKMLVNKINSIATEMSAEEESDQAITAIFDTLKQNPFWGEFEPLKDTTAEPGFFHRLWKEVFAKDT